MLTEKITKKLLYFVMREEIAGNATDNMLNHLIQ